MLIGVWGGGAVNAQEPPEHEAAPGDAQEIQPTIELREAAQTAGDDAALSPCLYPLVEEEAWIDGASRFMHQTVCESAFWLDGLFGEQLERQRKAARGAHGKLQLSAGYSEFYGDKYRARFDVKVDLTNINERLSAFAGRDTRDDAVRDRKSVGSQRASFPRFNDRDETVAGLGYSLPGNYRLKTDFRAGVRFSGFNPPRLFAQIRFAANVYSDESSLVDLRATPFINTRDGLGLTVTSDYSRVLSQNYLIRWNSTSTLTQESEGHSWRSALILYQRLSLKRAMAYEIFIQGAPEAPEPLTEYGAQISYRRPVLDERLFVTPVLGYSWPRVDPLREREGAYSVAVFLEVPFGDP